MLKDKPKFWFYCAYLFVHMTAIGEKKTRGRTAYVSKSLQIPEIWTEGAEESNCTSAA